MPSRRSKPAHKVTKRARAIEAPAPSAQPQPALSDDTPPVYFWRETDLSTGYLSQWYACAFTDDTDPTIIYPTAEHYMMYQKALLFSDPTMASQILQAEHPRQVKALGRQVANFTDKTWNAHREAIVRRGNRLKFTRPADPADGMWRVALPRPGGGESEGEVGEGKMVSIRELLLGTGEREIVEASPMDRVWGIGFGAARAGSVRGRWGLNLLGKALVAVRDELREEVKGEEGGGEGVVEAGGEKADEKGKEEGDEKGKDEGEKEGEKEGGERGEDKGKDNGEEGGEKVDEESKQKVKRRKTEKQG